MVWLRGGVVITPDDKYSFRNDGCKQALIINDTVFNDEMDYSIEADDKKSTAKLTVEGLYLVTTCF